jgi:hypothetical protein
LGDSEAERDDLRSLAAHTETLVWLHGSFFFKKLIIPLSMFSRFALNLCWLTKSSAKWEVKSPLIQD